MDSPGTFRHAAVIEYRDSPVSWFYSELGFDTLISSEIPDIEYMGALSGGALSSVSISKYENPQGSLIEVISVPFAAPSNCLPWNHVAISVGDCAAITESLVRGGGSLVGGPVQSTSGPYLVAYVRDPSGNLVELVQRRQESA